METAKEFWRISKKIGIGAMKVGGWATGITPLAHLGVGIHAGLTKPDIGLKEETVSPINTLQAPSFNFNFQGAFIGDVENFKKQVIDVINRDSELQSLGGT